MARPLLSRRTPPPRTPMVAAFPDIYAAVTANIVAAKIGRAHV